jgi:DNA-binding beta-propeller fold protein YncE
VAANGEIVHGGTVVRINTVQSPTMMPTVQSMTPIGNGFAERTDPAALVIGPTGVALAPDGSLYVADTLDNRIVSIADAVNRTTSALNGQTLANISQFNAPLGLAIRPNNGDILTVNGNNGMLVELRSGGQMVSDGLLDSQGTPPGAGTSFELATATQGLYFVNDGTNTLNLLANPL